MRENRTKRLLRDGKTVVGGWVCSSDPMVTELMADIGFDFVVIDTEHSAQTRLTIQAHMMALKDTEATPVVRAVWNDLVWVKLLLDAGAQGIVFPWINSVEEAEQAVRATRYPPRGLRGWGPRRAVRLADSSLDYYEHADENILVLCQIETQQALDQAEAIARVEGVDALMIGPADLSINLGVPLDWECKTFNAAVQRVSRAAEAAGKAFGIITSGTEMAKRWLEAGARVLIAGADLHFLKQIATQTLAELRCAIDAS